MPAKRRAHEEADPSLPLSGAPDRAIRTGTEPRNTAAQAVALMQMLDALKQSGETGRSVTIKPFATS